MRNFYGKLVAVVMLCAIIMSIPCSSFAAAKTSNSDWDLTRATVSYTDEGIVIKQTEMGIPDNQAIAILKVPMDRQSIEVEVVVEMEDYSASSRNPNDVWTAISFMGVPSFFNWRNSEQYGYAKDTPGIVNRFLSYDGDLRILSDVYQKDYKTSNDENAQVVDTWRLLEQSSGAKVDKVFKIKLAYETTDNQQFYQMYINDTLITAAGEFAFVDQSVAFPESIYLTIVMNTQDKDSNNMSKVTIKSINGEKYYSEIPNGNDEDKKDFPYLPIVIAGVVLLAGLGVFAVINFKKGSNNNESKN